MDTRKKLILQLVFLVTTSGWLPSTAWAEGAAAAMEEFGLIGVFAADCVKVAHNEANSSVWDVQSSGEATLTLNYMDPSNPTVIKKYLQKVSSAKMITDDKIQIIVGSGEIQSEIVLEGFGNSYRVILNRLVDRKTVIVEDGIVKYTGLPTPLLEKCRQ